MTAKETVRLDALLTQLQELKAENKAVKADKQRVTEEAQQAVDTLAATFRKQIRCLEEYVQQLIAEKNKLLDRYEPDRSAS